MNIESITKALGDLVAPGPITVNSFIVRMPTTLRGINYRELLGKVIEIGEDNSVLLELEENSTLLRCDDNEIFGIVPLNRLEAVKKMLNDFTEDAKIRDSIKFTDNEIEVSLLELNSRVANEIIQYRRKSPHGISYEAQEVSKIPLSNKFKCKIDGSLILSNEEIVLLLEILPSMTWDPKFIGNEESIKSINSIFDKVYKLYGKMNGAD